MPEGDTLVFVEVKTRTQRDAIANPGVYPAKRKCLVRAAQQLACAHSAWEEPCRFDLVCVYSAGDNYQTELIRDVITIGASSGTLWVVEHLWQPGDLSPRARECLESVDIVLAEDTKREGLACARWGVQVKRFVSYHDHNEKKKLPCCEWLRQRDTVALISDAVCLFMADPGYVVVRACREAGFQFLLSLVHAHRLRPC
jgi:hypothetical protein